MTMRRICLEGRNAGKAVTRDVSNFLSLTYMERGHPGEKGLAVALDVGVKDCMISCMNDTCDSVQFRVGQEAMDGKSSHLRSF